MSFNIYPAKQNGRFVEDVEHVDDWGDESTLNLSDVDFWYLMDNLGITLGITVKYVPSSLPLDLFEYALNKAGPTTYTLRLREICNIGRARGATCIAFA
jgi:hypothetical protein